MGLVHTAPLPAGRVGTVACPHTRQCGLGRRLQFEAQVAVEPGQIAALDQACGRSALTADKLDQFLWEPGMRNALLPHLHERLEDRWGGSVSCIAIVPRGQQNAQLRDVWICGFRQPADERRRQPFGAAALDVILQRDAVVSVELRVAVKRLAQAFRPMAAAPAAVQRIGVVVWGCPLVGAGHVATRRVDRVGQCLERNVAAPSMGEIAGSSA